MDKRKQKRNAKKLERKMIGGIKRNREAALRLGKKGYKGMKRFANFMQ